MKNANLILRTPQSILDDVCAYIAPVLADRGIPFSEETVLQCLLEEEPLMIPRVKRIISDFQAGLVRRLGFMNDPRTTLKGQPIYSFDQYKFTQQGDQAYFTFFVNMMQFRLENGCQDKFIGHIACVYVSEYLLDKFPTHQIFNFLEKHIAELQDAVDVFVLQRPPNISMYNHLGDHNHQIRNYYEIVLIPFYKGVPLRLYDKLQLSPEVRLNVAKELQFALNVKSLGI